jgi:ribosomal protein S18 acetylase RimI-like enzyme
MVNIVEVTNRSLMRKFVNFPLKLYEGNPYYCPAIFGDEYKLFFPEKNVNSQYSKSKFFLAYKDGEIVGRIAGLVIYPYIKKTGRKVMRFSRFDLIDDAEVARALFSAVENFAKEEGLDEIQGPMGYNDTDREGLLIYGFDKISTYAENYSYEYYVKHVENNGFKKEVDWLEYKIPIPEKQSEKISKIAELVAQRFKLKDVTKDENMTIPKMLKAYDNQIFSVLNKAYEPLHGTIPLEGKVVQDLLKTYKLFLLKDFVSIIVDENDKVIAFGAVLSGIVKEIQRCKGRITPISIIRLLKLKKHPETVEFALIAILPEWQKKGVNAMIMDKILSGLIKKGIRTAETNLELESNEGVISLWEGVDKQLIKRRRCYIKSIN